MVRPVEKRYNIHKMKIKGESGDVSRDTVISWKERIPELHRGYSAEHIWNLDETECFWCALPEYGFGRKGSQCKGGGKAKQRFMIANGRWERICNYYLEGGVLKVLMYLKYQ